MRKPATNTIGSLILVLLLLLGPGGARAADDSTREQALQQSGFVDPSAAIKNKLRVAVLPFMTPENAPDLSQYGEGAMDSLIQGLKPVPYLVVVDRGRMDKIIKEQALSQTGLVDPKTTVKIGKLLGAQVLVTGRIEQPGDGIRIAAEVTDVKSGKRKQHKTVSGPLEQIFDMEDQLVGMFLAQKQIPVTKPQQEQIKKVVKSTVKLNAYNEYLKGRTSYLLFNATGYAQAVKDYERAIQADPNYALAYAGLGETLALWGYEKQQLGQSAQAEYERAYDTSHKAVELNPDLPEAHRALGYMAHRLGRPGYREEVQKALTLNPNDAESWLDLWIASGHDKDPDQEYIRKALELNPDLITAHEARGIALRKLKRYEDAAAEYRESIRINPNVAFAHVNLGNVLKDLKQYDPAIAEYKEAIRLQPRLAEAYAYQGSALAAQEHLEEAVPLYQEALRLKPGDADTHSNLGVIYFRLGRWADCVKEWQETLRLNPNHGFAQEWLPKARAKMQGE